MVNACTQNNEDCVLRVYLALRHNLESKCYTIHILCNRVHDDISSKRQRPLEKKKKKRNIQLYKLVISTSAEYVTFNIIIVHFNMHGS